jgi:hypothetical protein
MNYTHIFVIVTRDVSISMAGIGFSCITCDCVTYIHDVKKKMHDQSIRGLIDTRVLLYILGGI